MAEDGKTPLLDDLEQGSWPSFVKEIKQAGRKSVMARALLHLLERSYRPEGHWKHGGIVGVRGYGAAA